MRHDQRGSVVIESLICMGVSLVVLVAVFNLGYWVIVRDASRSAIDQGVRAGAREGVDPVGACEDRIRQVVANAIGGAAGAGASASCSADAEEVRATITVPLRAWVPLLADRSTTASAVARREGLR